jgi:hypothetical protein
MTDHSTVEGKIEALSKKVESQARFTRGVLLLCTSAILAAMFYTSTEVLTTLPAYLLSLTDSHKARLHSTDTQDKAAQPPADSTTISK